jgi:nicotinate-nucleotide adenylyltransferase
LSERLGVFGGTFDPVHLGHLRAAECARAEALLDAVLFLPSGQPPHRRGPLASAFDRYAMVSLATAGQGAFRPSEMELVREGPSYTVDTLRALRGRHPEAELFLILGSDAFAEMGSWHQAAQVAAQATVVVIERPGPAGLPAPALPGLTTVRVNAPSLPVSSSEVRRLRGEGKSVRYLVPDPVADYIEKKELYR